MQEVTRCIAIAIFLCSVASVTALARGADAALGVVLGRPLGSQLSNVYSLTYGLALDVRLFHTPSIALSIQTAPVVAKVSPESGTLAADAKSDLLMWPGHVLFEYVFSQGAFRPYAGAGLGMMYVREKLAFTGPLGDRESSVSTTRVSFDILVGVEQGKSTRPFAELHYQHAGTSGIEDQSGSGVSLASVQLRLGVRTKLK